MLKKITRTSLCGLFVAVATFAEPELMEQVAKLTAADAAAEDYFGHFVSVDGDTAIVGATLDDDAGIDSGAAYVFERDQGGNWVQVRKLTADDAAAGDSFGRSVSVSGDTAVVGAKWDDDGGIDSGAAYVFERDQGGPGNWGQVAKLTAADGEADDRFGRCVSLSGDTAIIGAIHDDDGGSNSGAAYVFERDQGDPDNWDQVAKLIADDAAAEDHFGIFVSVSGDTAIVGASRNDDAGANSGAAYVFERDQGGPGNWGQVTKLTADDAAADDQFGTSVSISGDTAIVGADWDDDGAIDSGSAYVFERDQGGPGNWGQVAAKLTADDAAASDHFGLSVFLSGDTAIVGARDDHAGIDSGSAYVFKRDQGGPDNWGQVAKLIASDAAAGDRFGCSVSLSGDTAIVGAYMDDDAGSDSGSAYIFSASVLTIPTAIPAASAASIDVPVELTTNDNDLASLAFSVDYDATCLSFDPTDADADGIPDAIDIPLPGTFSAIVFHDLGDTDGELDFTLFANDPTTTTFSAGTLATITFTATCSSGPIDPVIAPVMFSSDPIPSFGDPDAQSVFGNSVDGSVEIFSGMRGDCNADGLVSAPDVTAEQLESFDGDGTFWADTLVVVPYLGSPVGCDSNADTLVDAGDLSCTARLIFGLTCGGARAVAAEGPRLSLPTELSSTGEGVVAAITFEPRGAAVNSLIFSLDYDETRLTFDDVPGAVRFFGEPVSLRSLTFDAGDTDGELDVVIADLTTTRVLSEGLLVEVDLRLLEAGTITVRDGVTFSAEPPASFGDVEGHSVPGTAEIDTAIQVLFADGFESGDTSAWTEQ